MARSGRGHYKVFLGMAAGVGKTYRMLQEGQAEARAGRDVVIAYLEPHGRAETDAQAEGLERLPRRKVDYRGTRARGAGPAGRLHNARPSWRWSTSSPTPTLRGSSITSATRTSRTSRGRDRRLLDGQHPASQSLDDRVAELTGVRVRETFPDTVLEGRRRGGADRPDPRGAHRPSSGGQDLSGGPDRRLTQQLLPDREPGYPARARPAADRRGGRGEGAAAPRRGAARDRSGGRRSRPPPVGERVLALVTPRESSCGWSGGRGARPSGSAPSSTCCTSLRPAPSPAPRSASSSGRSAGWRPSSGLG